MLYICIPSYNEAPTVGVLLWRIRKVFQEFSREYEVLVYDDGSTDATAETLAPYRDVMPLTVLGGSERRGYATAIDALCRAVSKRTRYPRRDAAIFLQGDFTDQPEHIPELVKRFEGGADVVVAERPAAPDVVAPVPVRRLGRVAPWVVRPFVSVPGVRDPFGSYRLYRIAVLRDVVRAAGTRGVVVGDASAPSWAANVELLLNAAAFARRVETVELAPRYDVRPRETRIRPFADAMGLFRFARAARSRRLKPAAGGASPAGREREGSAVASPNGASEAADVMPSRSTAVAAPSAPTADVKGRSSAKSAPVRESVTEASGAASAATPASERRRSRRSRGERRPTRPATDTPPSSPELESDGASPRDGADRVEPARAKKRRAPARRDDTPRDAGDRDAAVGDAVVRDVVVRDVAEGEASADEAAASGAPESGAEAPGEMTAEAEARRQRQRARRKRSRQRRAARDGSRDESSSTEAAPPAAEASAPAHEDVPSPRAERQSRAEPRSDAEPAPSSPAASPVVQ